MPSSVLYETNKLFTGCICDCDMLIKLVKLLVSYCTEDGISLPKHVYFKKNCRFPELFNFFVVKLK